MTEIRKLFLVLVNVVTSDCQEVNDNSGTQKKRPDTFHEILVG